MDFLLTMVLFGVLLSIAFGVYLMLSAVFDLAKFAIDASPEERKELRKEVGLAIQYGALNPRMICPHCQTKGSVHTKQRNITQAHCGNCHCTWTF